MQLEARIHMGNSTSIVVFLRAGDPSDPLTHRAQAFIRAMRHDLSYEHDPEDPQSGTINLMTETGIFPSGLVPRVQRLLTKYAIEHALIDTRQAPADEVPMWAADKHVQPRDYQLAFAEKALRLGRGVIDSPPRSGKTTCGILIFDRNPLPTIWIAPTKGIVKQTHEAITRALPHTYVLTLLGEGSRFAKIMARSVHARTNTVPHQSHKSARI